MRKEHLVQLRRVTKSLNLLAAVLGAIAFGINVALGNFGRALADAIVTYVNVFLFFT